MRSSCVGNECARYTVEQNSATVRPAERMRLRKVPLATVEWFGTGGHQFSRLGHDDMSPSLPCHAPAQALKVSHSFCATQSGQLRHYSATSTCRVSTVKGIPDSARTSIQSSIASRMFARASSFVSPWHTHPGMEGHSATQTPSSSRPIVTVSFIAGPRWLAVPVAQSLAVRRLANALRMSLVVRPGFDRSECTRHR